MRDVFMDLYAESVPFLNGKGHQGMVIGATNILKLTINKISKTLEENPGYNLMVIGYSLGAGICQLVAMDLIEGILSDQFRHLYSDLLSEFCFWLLLQSVFRRR